MYSEHRLCGDCTACCEAERRGGAAAPMGGTMIDSVHATLHALNFGEVQFYRNLAIFPILGDNGAGPDYITLSTAMKEKLLTVTEVSEDGSVPKVHVKSSADIPVLLLDGEELIGAKQNRVLNATILLKPRSTTSVDVSCSERGRWRYSTTDFWDSNVVMARAIRAGKNRAVSASLRESCQFRSDQGEVWERIDTLSETLGTQSRTSAMRDIFVSRESEMNACLKEFVLIEGQQGLAFAINGVVVGLDFVSRAGAYATLHDKLVKSYAIDSPIETSGSHIPSVDAVHNFLSRIDSCTETRFPSVGYGSDYRYESQDLCGSVLVHDDVCIHGAFFSLPSEERRTDMRGMHQRRAFRRSPRIRDGFDEDNQR